MKTSTIFVFLFVFLLVIPLIQAQENQNEKILNEGESQWINLTVQEKLEVCTEEYNGLLDDYRKGLNCGDAFYMLENMNKLLSEERDICREEVGELKVYKLAFYILLGVLLIVSVIIIYKATKK